MDLFGLYAKISLDTSEYENGLDDASKNTSNFADKLKTGLATAAKVGAAALTAAATGVAALTKASIDQYAEYEQLIGGVDTLFKEASDTVQQYAANAFQTAGMSANEYMDTVTSFSASLIQSLEGDTAAAAEYANQAITDMSDNANKMGTSIEMIQNAYQGFAKQNYTMLDNLKLGYGGTQAEMYRLMEDAEKLGAKFNSEFYLTSKGQFVADFADITTAIHVIQTEMGITGTTAAEAASTIQGSVASAKAAWTNLMTGIADENADLDTLISQFVTSAETAAGNIIPRVTQILSGMGAAIEQLAPILATEVPRLITAVLPSLVSAGAQLLVGLVTGLVSAVPQLVAAVPGIISAVVESLTASGPALLAAGVALMTMLTNGVGNGIPEFVAKLPEIVDNFLNFISEHLPEILAKGVETLNSFVTGILNEIPGMLAQLPAIITSFVSFVVENLPKIVQAGMDILGNLVIGIIDNLPEIGNAVGQIMAAIVQGIIDLLGAVIDAGKQIVAGIWQGITSMGSWITEKVTGFFGGIIDGVKDFLGIHSPSTVFADMGRNMALGLGEGWDNEYDRIRRNIEGGLDFGTANVDFASSGLGVASAGMVNGISSAFQDTSGGTITVNLMMPDGTKFASYLLGPLSNYAKANGTPILNPT